MLSLKLSSPAEEGVLTVSKWAKHQVLLDGVEMQQLMRVLQLFGLYNISEVVMQPEVSLDTFLKAYCIYIESLKSGSLPNERSVRRLFSSALSTTPDALYAMQMGERILAKPIRPVVQMQLHHFLASSADGKFYPMVFGPESITWGIQFSYPQIYQHPKSHEFAKVVDSPEFPNTRLFLEVVRWLRSHTAPTTFIRGGKKTATSFRLGKQCFSWIGRHPGLKELTVHVY